MGKWASWPCHPERPCLLPGTVRGVPCARSEERDFCLLVVARACANVEVLGDVERCVAQLVIPRLGPVQPRRHKGRGAGRCCPIGRIAFVVAMAVEKGGGQEAEGNQAKLRVSG